MLLPPSVKDYVTPDNPVRAIKAYVETVDFEALGFKNAGGQRKAGQPAYAPSDLPELYLYGYLHRVRSSRNLEAECRRNLEVIWLLNGLRPGYHTIADFRKDNPKALKKTNSHFIQLCADLGLFGGKVIGFFLVLFSRLVRLLRAFFGVAGLFPLPKTARPAARLGHATAC